METSLSYLLLKATVEIESQAQSSSVTHPRPEEQCQPRTEPGLNQAVLSPAQGSSPLC